jgi:hypothetical protein
MTFAFNYGDETVDISELVSNAIFTYGGSKLGPHEVSIWETQMKEIV